jgi:MOSC domain-containing protein YiiM
MAATDAGRLEAIHLADGVGAPVRAVPSVAARAGVGLAGDRYGDLGQTRVSSSGNARGDVTLIEAEQIEWLAAETGIRLAPGETRRNLTTRGVRLNDLVGRRFRIGSVSAEGLRLCEPCAYLQAQIGKPILEPLVHRAGLRARLLDDGELRVGDPIEVEPD